MTGPHEAVTDALVDEWIFAHQAEMLEAMKRLVRIRSVGEGFFPEQAHPFGEGCAQAVDLTRELITLAGLQAKEHDYYGISAVYPGDSERTISFFSHLDVVPEGSGWSFDPYDPFVKDGYLFGRGAADNKGAVIGVLYVLKFLRDHNLRLNHTITAFLGCNEESGMRDVEHYLRSDTPSFSVVSDGFFPLGNGEKGILIADFVADVSGSNLLSFTAGELSNVVPHSASAVIQGFPALEVQAALGDDFAVTESADGLLVRTEGIGGHAAFPEGTINPIPKLARALLECGLLTGKARTAAAFIASAFADYYGHGLHVDAEDEVSGKATHTTGLVRLTEGKLVVNVNLRYPVSANAQTLIDRMREKGAAYGYSLANIEDNPPFYIPETDPIVRSLADLANQRLKTDLPTYVMGGATHARKLPHAVSFGPSRSDIGNPFPAGRGKPHQPDEALRLQDIWDSIKIYIHAVLLLDKMVD
ncbi:peptidase M20 [Paenibacillus faecis]|uniref:Sapep family Mn(2+)-dependent dipeptidase n=1 Tax=Paenibacillus faecis TaxID=862114 RepID=UPI001B07C6BF|nr:Sapep family Mn(2+)-dependent dipeptidase [Paenibacillus faecis]GIO86137.1 peptidase M20 [Paenibacillus faecis]